MEEFQGITLKSDWYSTLTITDDMFHDAQGSILNLELYNRQSIYMYNYST
jgi:hypothetical protein